MEEKHNRSVKPAPKQPNSNKCKAEEKTTATEAEDGKHVIGQKQPTGGAKVNVDDVKVERPDTPISDVNETPPQVRTLFLLLEFLSGIEISHEISLGRLDL